MGTEDGNSQALPMLKVRDSPECSEDYSTQNGLKELLGPPIVFPGKGTMEPPKIAETATPRPPPLERAQASQGATPRPPPRTLALDSSNEPSTSKGKTATEVAFRMRNPVAVDRAGGRGRARGQKRVRSATTGEEEDSHTDDGGPSRFRPVATVMTKAKYRSVSDELIIVS